VSAEDLVLLGRQNLSPLFFGLLYCKRLLHIMPILSPLLGER
jgi:hypothetical protein